MYISGGHLAERSRTIKAILLEDIMRNISVRLFGIWTCGLGEDVV